MNTKTEKVAAWARAAKAPFAIEDAQRALGNVSQQTIYNALNRIAIKSASRPRGGHFYRLYFPVHWSFDECKAYLDKQTESGKSRAHIHCNEPEKPIPTTPTRRRTFKNPRPVSHPMDVPEDD